MPTKTYIATITTTAGRTSRDHLLTEIARQARELLTPAATKRTAIRRAERAIAAVIATRPSYASCGAGLVVTA